MTSQNKVVCKDKYFRITVKSMEKEARVMNSSDKLTKLHFIQQLVSGP